jgi:predicted dehydrogenase
MMQVRVGVIGTGRMAETMIATMTRAPEVRVAGVASSSGNADRASRLAAKFGIPNPYADSAPLLARDDIDLIYIANETRAHAATSIAALRAGKAVLCEKPFATTLAEGHRVAEAARQSGCLFMEAIWTPFLPAYERLFELARTNAIGVPAHLSASFGYPASPSAHPRLFDTDGGGVLLDRAVYPITLALKLFGPIETVEASLVKTANGVDSHVNLQLGHRSGGQSQLTASLNNLLSNTAVIAGPTGSITLEPPLAGAEQVTIRRMKPVDGTPSGDLSPTKLQKLLQELRSVSALRSLRRYLSDGRREQHSYGASKYGPQLQHVLGLLSSKKRESDIIPIEFSLEVLGVIDAVRSGGNQVTVLNEMPV